MPAELDRPFRARRPDTVRRVAGALMELGIKAYGAAAALSVALSDAETVAGKSNDAIRAVPNLTDRYDDAIYLVEHREEIQTALDYVNQNAPDAEELEATAQQSTETLGSIETTYDEIIEARDALGLDPRTIPDAVGHLQDAWDAKPDLGSIGELADAAESAVPFIDQVEVLIPAFYGGVLTIADNFASDEIAGTLFVMGAALALAFVLARGIGFWARRGAPGPISRMLQSWGARLHQGWYVRNLEFALGDPLYAAARKHTQDVIVADPEAALDPAAFRELEAYFEGRRGNRPSP